MKLWKLLIMILYSSRFLFFTASRFARGPTLVSLIILQAVIVVQADNFFISTVVQGSIFP